MNLDRVRIIKDVTYNAAGQITQMRYSRDPSGSSYYTETRRYKVLQRLTRLTVPGALGRTGRFRSGGSFSTAPGRSPAAGLKA